MSNPVPAIAEFLPRVRTASWFSFVGAPLTDAEREDAAAYAGALGLGDLEIGEMSGWRDAEACIKRTDWDVAWWQAEDDLRRTLLDRAARKIGDMALTRSLTELSERVSDAVHGAAAVAAARGGVADQGLTRSAAGAATMAAYQAAVERAADSGGGRPFAAKFRLFEAGHWPLCVRAGTFHVF